MMRRVQKLFFIFISIFGISCYPEQGQWDLKFDQDNYVEGVSRSMYKDTGISLTVSPGSSCKTDVIFEASWMLRYTPCADEYNNIDQNGQKIKRLEEYFIHPTRQQIQNLVYSDVSFKNDTVRQKCNSHFNFPDKSKEKETILPMDTENTNTTSSDDEDADDASDSDRRKRSTDNKNITVTTAPAAIIKEGVDQQQFVKAWEDGMYMFILKIVPRGLQKDENYNLVATVRMTSVHGKISASDWPLLVFYGVMGLLYIIYGIIWIVMLSCNWKDLLRVQFWIGGVIVLGMLEKAVFFAEYENIANNGQSVKGAVLFAELVSAVKRTLARMLVIIVSLGFGIIRPRLGPTLTKVLGVGGLYFILASVEGCMRVTKPKSDQSKELLLIGIPLQVTEAAICWWIFSSLVQTTRTLRLRRNIVKLSLYRHFTNTLIFAILASVTFMIWSLTQHKFKTCLTDWKELWVDEAFWHLLFCVILAVIMVLWRPSANNQRYAFSPLLDAADDEDDEDVLMSDAFTGMKMRGSKSDTSQKNNDKSADDDLKWVEENIPSSIVDKALPSLLDSDEEEVTTKYEMSKMD